MKTLIIILTITLTSFTAAAQEIQYKVTSDNPALPGIQAWFTPFYAEYFSLNTTLGWGGGARYNVNEKFAGEFRFSMPYGTTFDQAYRDMDNVHNANENQFKKVLFLRLGGSFTFSSVKRKKPIRIVLKSSSGMNFSTVSYINVTGTVRSKRSVRGGVYSYRSAVSTDQLPNELAVTTNGDQFSKYGYTPPGGTRASGSGNNLDWGTQMNVVSMYAGISFQSVTNLKVSTSNYGERSNSKFWDFYVDVLFAPVVSIDDILYNENSYPVVGDGENQFGVNRMGFRTGVEWNKTSKAMNMGFRTELGVRPGIKGNGFYFNLYYYLPVFNFLRN